MVADPMSHGTDSDTVHVWWFALDVDPAERTVLAATLSADERARAGRFLRPIDRERYITARGVLRHLLGDGLGCAPAEVSFRYGPRGKPGLDGGEEHRLEFNLSHRESQGIVALARGRRVGIDVERINPGLIEERIPEQFFSPREVAALRALPRELQPGAFFACWTRKEAYVKARGDGLSLGLDRFDVSLSPGEPAALLRTEDDPLDAERWSLHALTRPPDIVAALAVEGRPRRIEQHAWPLDRVASSAPQRSHRPSMPGSGAIP